MSPLARKNAELSKLINVNMILRFYFIVDSSEIHFVLGTDLNMYIYVYFFIFILSVKNKYQTDKFSKLQNFR